MDKNNDEPLPRNPIEAQGQLIKAFYKKFGSEAIPIIEKVLKRQGKSLGLKIKKKLPDDKLSTVAKAFSKSFDPKYVEVLTLNDKTFRITGTRCPFGLENTSRELCEAVMAIDSEYFFTATNGKTILKIIKTVAEGDPICDTIYTVEND
jgi:predicted hydrocarbon binding protein